MQHGVIILAAGKGTRMKSQLPKVLHKVGGTPMVTHLIDLAETLNAQPTVIFGHEGHMLQETLSTRNVTWVEQREQLGTGHAVLQTIEHLKDDVLYFILVGDAPLIRQETLQELANSASASGIAVLTVEVDNPFGYGRIVRGDDNHARHIVEEKDASAEQKKITEINSGVFAISGKLLKNLLPRIENNNAQGEYYLTDIVSLATTSGHPVAIHCINDMSEVLGCNNKVQLQELERIYQRRQAEKAMLDGATLADANRFDVRGTLSVGNDCFIDVNAVFIGDVTLGNNVTIGPNCTIESSVIEENTTVLANTVIENSHIGAHAAIGPFARLRPKTRLAQKTKIGNFVETKNATIAEGSKVNHLSYVGDAVVAENVNIGAGTITCNYDGANKHTTTIESDCFIGSNSALVAPVTIAQGTTVAAGSTITKNTNPAALAIARSKQLEIAAWKRPQKKS